MSAECAKILIERTATRGSINLDIAAAYGCRLGGPADDAAAGLRLADTA
jgi:hypothetical protein